MEHVHENIIRIKAVYNLLGDLKEKVVFVGGATVSLYAEREAQDIRETQDVDILVEIASRSEYAEVEERLRQVGFANDTSAGFLGRYLQNGLIVDVMATDEVVLGFSNRWYANGFRTAINYKIDDQRTVKIFDPPHFVATKLEAFKNRGNGDGRTSSDFEDIVFILDNRPAIWQEMLKSDFQLREYLRLEFKKLYENPHIEEWLGSHSGFYSTPGPGLMLQDLKLFVNT